jgi:hypothetical protein
VLLSEIELGGSQKEGMSTIIGKMTTEADADLPPAAAGKPTPPASSGDSGITLAGDSGITLGSDSDLKLAGGSTIPLGGAADSDVKLVSSGSDIGLKAPGGSSDKLFGSDALKLSDDELSLVDTGPGSSAPPKSGDSSKKGAGSSIKLGDEELEVVLGGGSDVTQSPTDSGIQLISASDSGLSLDQPLALGSSARRLLDVTEDATEQVDSPDTIEELKADDDFLLTSMDDAAEESSDSGSQVIALDADDEISSGMFAPLAGGAGLLEEEPSSGGLSGAPVLTAPTTSFAPAPAVMTAAVPAEAPFSTANVMILAVCVLLLGLCGMMTFDLMRNMWSWDGPYTANSSIMESLGNTVGWFEK